MTKTRSAVLPFAALATLAHLATGCSEEKAPHLGSTALASTANVGTLTSAVYHQVPDAVFADSRNGESALAAYAAANAPTYTFSNTSSAFVFDGSSGGGSGTPTATFLGGDAVGAAASDTATVADTIVDSKGYFAATMAGAYTFHIGAADDGVNVYINGDGSSGSGTLVASNTYTSLGTSDATITLAASAKVPLEIVYGNGYGGAYLDGIRITDPSGAQVAYFTGDAPGDAGAPVGTPPVTGGPVAAGTYLLENVAFTQGLAVSQADSYDGNVLVTFTVNTGAGQQFAAVPGANGTYQLQEQIAGRCLQASGAMLTIDTCSGAATQAFTLGAQSDGSYTIVASDGGCVTADGPFNLVEPASCSGASSQHWQLSSVGGGGPTPPPVTPPDAGAPPTSGCSLPLPDPNTAPSSIDPSCYTATFTDDFSTYDISSGTVDDGKYPNERWFNGTDECCMSPSNGWPGVMYPTASQSTGSAVNPYSLLPGGGLQISLTEQNDEWFSGVMTSVDGNENGFAQAYGYFEMTTQLPPGTGTWPSFWMLSLPRSAPGGEIDIFEQLGCSPPLNPAVEKIFHFTLHDWKDGTTPLAYTAQDLPDLTAGYHRYGMLWNKTYMALYFDGQLLTSAPTPAVMIDVKYFLLADLGIGAGWDTTQTPSPSNMLIKSINAYSVPGF